MRRAFADMGWLTSPESSAVYGFSLGYDFCGEHEYGARFIKQALGIAESEAPQGVPDRTMTQVPQALRFFAFEHRSRDKRFKRTMPAALLVCADRHLPETVDNENMPELLRRLDVSFDADFAADKTWYDSKKHDVVCAWSAYGGFAILVRGQENVQHLTDLHEAFQACAVSVADPSIMGFKRKALALVMNDRLDPKVAQDVLEKDQAYLRLLTAAKDTGIEAVLAAAGLKWYALTPAWEYEEGSDLLFFLNPAEQGRFSHGWFKLEQLQEWAQGKGPVVDSNAIAAELKRADPDWGIHLLRGLNGQGFKLRHHEQFVWLDEAKTQPGVRLNLHRDSAPGLVSGVYPLTQMEPFVEAGRARQTAAAQA